MSAPGSAATSASAAGAASAIAPGDWDSVLTAAKKEGKVVLSGPPDEVFRQAAASAFQQRYGIQLEYLPLAGAEAIARVQREAVAQKESIDLGLFGGGGLAIIPQGLLDPIKPALLLPEVTDLGHWRDDKLKWMDSQQEYLLQAVEGVDADLFVNPDSVNPASLTSWKDLLKPEYKGKIDSFDPRRAGAGQAAATYLLQQFGPDYVRQLYLDQGVVLSSDERQVAEWVGRGTYTVGLGLVQRQVEPLRALGLKFQRVFPADGPGELSGGTGVLSMIKNRPHDKAGIVLANWLLTKEGQELYSKAYLIPSRRTDVQVVEVPDYLKPQPGVNYLDQYDGNYYSSVRPKAQQLLLDTIGR
ncbi:MAG TPA: extracellular solute-binding protein [Chloroflexota bacterium]|nr:extracellular solute-binding protein [Chloroflexota bacterium]